MFHVKHPQPETSGQVHGGGGNVAPATTTRESSPVLTHG